MLSRKKLERERERERESGRDLDEGGGESEMSGLFASLNKGTTTSEEIYLTPNR